MLHMFKKAVYIIVGLIFEYLALYIEFQIYNNI